MTYTLKLEIDGFELATLLRELGEHVDRTAPSAHSTRDERLHHILTITVLQAFLDELPLGLNDYRVLKPKFDREQMDILLDVLRGSILATQGDHDERARAIRKVFQDITDYREVDGL